MDPLFSVGFLIFVSSVLNSATTDTSLTVSLGDDVTLPCSSSEVFSDVKAVVLEWTRADLNRSVLFYRDGHLYPRLQHPAFKHRVHLTHPHLRGGDLSMVLKSARLNDSGTYQCHFIGDTGRKRRSITKTTPLSTTHLTVQVKPLESRVEQKQETEETEETEDSTGRSRLGLYGLCLVGEAVVVLGFICVYRKYKRRLQTKLSEPAQQPLPVRRQTP